MAEDEEGLDFLCREIDGWDGIVTVEAVSAKRGVPHDGRVEAVAQISQVAFDGGAGDFEFFHEPAHGDGAVLLEETFNAVDTLECAHRDHAKRGRRD